MPEIYFTVLGNPKPQPRPRAGVRKIFDRYTGEPRFVVRAYDDSSAEGWKALVADAVRPHLPSDPIATPITAQFAFHLDRPGRLKRRKDPDGRMPCDSRRDDCDNLAKAVMDVLTQCRLWADDGLVWRLLVSKQWAEKHGGRPGMDCWIQWSDDDQPVATPKRKAAPSAREEAHF